MKQIHVVAAIIKKDNKILIAKRLKGEFKGLWEFPGGKIEPQENALEALKREIKEELEIDITINKHFMQIEYDYPSFHLIMDCYLCSIHQEIITLHDHEEIKWIDINHHEDINWIPADIQIVEKLKNLVD